MIELTEAKSKEEFKTGVDLFQEYATQLGVDLEFQNFREETHNIETQYSRPDGALFIADNDLKKVMGCFGVRSLEQSICELKRMYLRKEARGMGIGKQLLIKSLEVGKELGFKKMRLDTLPTMESAIGLYIKMGFCEIDPYRYNPIDGTKYFEIALDG